MKHNRILKRMTAAFLGMVMLQGVAHAQSYKIQLDKPEIEKLQSPDLAGSIGNKSYKPKDWMEIEVKFKIEASDKKLKFADKVTVKWYLAMKAPDGKKGFVLLEKEINHVNVPIGEDIYTSIYLSPTAVQRLTDGDKVSKGDIEHVGGEIRVNGQAAYKGSGFFTLKGKITPDKKWWTSGSLARYEKVPLRNKDETPFKNLWYDRYAEIEVKR